MKKPPAFLLYAGDYLSDPMVQGMSPHQRGIRFNVLAAMWISDEPGTLPLPIEIAARLARSDPRSLRDLVAKYPRCFVEVDGKLVSEELREQYAKLLQFKQSQADAARRTNEKLGRKPSVSESVSESVSVRSSSSSSSSSSKEGTSLVQFPQDHASAKPQEPVPMRSQIDKAIGKTADQMKPSAGTSGGQRAHLEAGIFRKKIEAAYFDATKAEMKPDDCIREAIDAGALSLLTNRSVELRGLDHKDLARNVWEQIRNGVAALHLVEDFDTRSRQVVAVITPRLASFAMEFLERTGAERGERSGVGVA